MTHNSTAVWVKARSLTTPRCERRQATRSLSLLPASESRQRWADWEMGYQAVIVNAILDTGISLVSACEKLTGAGVQEIHIMVTHGLFTGTRWKEL